jgi:hypothetical protein
MGFRDMLNFNGVNWWTLLGGLGLNFIITIITSLAGAYLATNEGTAAAYAQFGPAAVVLVVFLCCVGAGFIVAKLADDLPVKHAFLSSLGAVAPYVFVAVTSFNPMPLMMAAVAVAGNLNGGMLARPKPRYSPPGR